MPLTPLTPLTPLGSATVSTDEPPDQLPALTREFLTIQGVALVQDVVELDYDSWTACESVVAIPCSWPDSGLGSYRGVADILNSILPNEGLDDAPSSFTQTGHIGESSRVLARRHRHTSTIERGTTLIRAVYRPCESQGRMVALQTPHWSGHP